MNIHKDNFPALDIVVFSFSEDRFHQSNIWISSEFPKIKIEQMLMLCQKIDHLINLHYQRFLESDFFSGKIAM